MKKLFTAVLFAAALAIAPAAMAADMKIGYVDIQKALNVSEAGKDARDQLGGRVKKFQDEINAKQEELKKLKDELEKQSAFLSEAKKNEKEKDYAQKLKDYQRFAKDAQEELQGRDEEFTKKILDELEKVIQDFGKKNGYTFIFVRSEAMVFADDKADLTDAIVKQFNASRKK